jgi:hypothetical protein
MSGKINTFSLFLVSAGIVLLGVFFIQKTEASGPYPGDIQLQALFIDQGANIPDPPQILSDGQGPYINGQAPAGSVVVKIVGPNRSQRGRFVMSIDNAGDPNGRYLNLLLGNRKWPCDRCENRDTATIEPEFAFNSPVQTRFVEFDSWGSTEPDSDFLFNFLSMETGRPYYVAMGIYFRVTKADGLASNQYDLGGTGSIFEVTASGPSGAPTSWTIKSVDPNGPVFGDCTPSHYQILFREYQSLKPKGSRYSLQCYGWYYVPFELRLFRLS